VVEVHEFFAGGTWTKPILTYTRNIQLIVAIVWEIPLIAKKAQHGLDVMPNCISVFFIVLWLILHRRDVRMENATQAKRAS
jgi:hypothetical protein